MIDYSAYTVGSNQPLTNARILYAPISGTITGTGTNPDYAANDYTSQRWQLAPGANNWLISTAANVTVDTLFIAAHNLTGKTITVQTAAAVGGPYTTRDTSVITDTSTICVMFNNAGTPYTVREVKILVDEGSNVAIGIIRLGVALQMPIPLYGGHKPLNLNRVTEAQQNFSETGQWLGRIVKRRAVVSTYDWDYITAAWYTANFEPFAQTLPLNPFCIAGNPSKMAEDVGYVWTSQDVQPANMGTKDFRSVSLDVTGYY